MKFLNIKKIDKNDFYYIFGLFLTVLLIGLFNYKPGLMLIGWDNLHPEFKPLNYFLGKTLFGVWHTSYGLGAIIANAPYTELIRLPFYFLLQLIFGLENVRFIWHLSALLIGGVGFYFFSKRVITDRKTLSFAGALFYMLNIGTLQNFYQPLEPFSHFFMFLPWAILLYVKVLEDFNLENIFLLFFINLLGTASFQVTPIFIIYVIVLFILSISYFNFKRIKTILVSAVIVLVANIFWVFPYAHFALTGKQYEIASSRTYKIFSEEALIRNDNGSKFSNSIFMKGFWFNTIDNIDGRNVYVLEDWIDHFDNFFVKLVMLTFLILVFWGLVRSFVGYKKPVSKFLILSFFISLIALAGPNPPFGFIANFIRNNVPLFSEVFRLSFTKFIVLYSLIYSSLAIFGLGSLLDELKINNFRKSGEYLFIFLIFVYALPTFKGNFINSSLFSYIPRDYFVIAEYLDENDPKGRILYLPNSPTVGWTHYSWGYRGSGFLWYLVENPVLDEAFEVHSKYNSDASQELKEAYLSNSPDDMADLMDKYDIKYLLLDKNINTCEGDCRKYIDEIFDNFENSKVFKREKSSGSLRLLSRIVTLDGGVGYSEHIFDREEMIEKYNNRSISKTIDQDTAIEIQPPYLEDSFSFYNIQQKNNSLVIKPYLPFVTLNNIQVSYQSFDFERVLCENCSNVLLESAEDVEYWGVGYPSELGIHNSLGLFSVYNPQAQNLAKIENKDVTNTMQFCSNINNPKSVSVGWESLGDSAIRITAKKSSPCFSKKFTNMDQDFFGITVLYETNSDVNLEIAFISPNENKKVYFLDLPANKTEVREHFKLGGFDPDPEVFFVLRALGDDNIRINIKNIEIGYGFEKIGEIKLPKDNQIYLDVKAGDILNFSDLYPINAEKMKYSINPLTYQKNDYKVCSGEIDNLVEDLRQEGSDELGSFFDYKSSNHRLCETISVTSVHPKGSYLIETKSQNIQGGNIEVCLSENYTLYCKQKYKIDGINRNILNNEDSNYMGRLDQVTFYTNHAASSDVRENKLYSVAFEFLPFNWLGSISAVEDAKLVKADKKLPFFYLAEVEKNENSLVTNYQSYDRGWKVYSLGNRCDFTDHKISGWANGWDVNCKSDAKIRILFMPQIYMFVGLVVISGTAILLIRLKRVKNHL